MQKAYRDSHFRKVWSPHRPQFLVTGTFKSFVFLRGCRADLTIFDVAKDSLGTHTAQLDPNWDDLGTRVLEPPGRSAADAEK